MANDYYMIQMNDIEAAELLKKMAQDDLRSLGNQVAWLIRQEWNRRKTDDLPADKKSTSTEQP